MVNEQPTKLGFWLSSKLIYSKAREPKQALMTRCWAVCKNRSEIHKHFYKVPVQTSRPVP